MTDWGDAPTILIFSDTEAGMAAASDGALAVGGRIVGALPIDQALDRLDSQLSVDLVILDISEDRGDLLDVMFQRLEQDAEAGRFASVVTLTPELIDMAAARIGHGSIHLLVGRDPRAQRLAVAMSLSRTPMQIRDGDEEDQDEDQEEPIGDIDFTSEMERIAQILAESSEDGSLFGLEAKIPEEVETDDGRADRATVRYLIRARRLREQFFHGGMFADPAWDILLDLTAARIEGRSVAVSSLCIAAAVPATTALRWIKQLTDAGFLRRVADPEDGRRVFIELTDDATRTMTAYLAALARSGRI